MSLFDKFLDNGWILVDLAMAVAATLALVSLCPSKHDRIGDEGDNILLLEAPPPLLFLAPPPPKTSAETPYLCFRQVTVAFFAILMVRLIVWSLGKMIQSAKNGNGLQKDDPKSKVEGSMTAPEFVDGHSTSHDSKNSGTTIEKPVECLPCNQNQTDEAGDTDVATTMSRKSDSFQDELDELCPVKKILPVPLVDPTKYSGMAWKTIIVFGETGVGKSTTLNSFVNYLFGVEFDDDFRYVLIEEGFTKDQTESVTKNVT